MDDPAGRLTALETLSAEQARTIEELSGQIAAQWMVIEKLRASLDVLVERFRAVEDNAQPDIPATRPPHW